MDSLPEHYEDAVAMYKRFQRDQHSEYGLSYGDDWLFGMLEEVRILVENAKIPYRDVRELPLLDRMILRDVAYPCDGISVTQLQSDLGRELLNHLLNPDPERQ